MKPKLGPASVAEERLLKLLRSGSQSEVLRARLVWSEAEGIARYLRPLVGRDRIHPRILPTAQVSGRWSTTNPPRVMWPAHDPSQCPECEARRHAQ